VTGVRLAQTPLGVAGLALALLALFAGARWAAGGRDWTRFAVAGSEHARPGETPVPVQVVPGNGYDGQFYLRFAFDPFEPARDAHGIRLDAPAYRQQRVLLPALAWALSGGSAARAPAALVLVNLLALAALAGCMAALGARSGVSPAWGLLAALLPGCLMGLGRDLTEPLAGALVAAALLLALERPGWAPLALGAALFAKDTTVLAAAAFALACLARPETRRLALGLVPALAPFALWQLALRRHWGHWPWQEAAEALRGGWFVRGLSVHARRLPDDPLESLVGTAALLWLAWLALEALRAGWAGQEGGAASRADATPATVASASPARAGAAVGPVPRARALALRFAAFTALGWLAVSPRMRIWGEHWGFLRVLLDAQLAALAFVFLRGRRPSLGFAALTLALGAVVAGRLVLRP
jgi:hypothetical protein